MNNLSNENELSFGPVVIPTASPSPRRVVPFPLEDFDGNSRFIAADVPRETDHRQVELRIGFGRARIPLGELAQLRAGSILLLDQLAGEPVDLYADGRLLARGELLVLDNVLGVRIVELLGKP